MKIENLVLAVKLWLTENGYRLAEDTVKENDHLLTAHQEYGGKPFELKIIINSTAISLQMKYLGALDITPRTLEIINTINSYNGYDKVFFDEETGTLTGMTRFPSGSIFKNEIIDLVGKMLLVLKEIRGGA
ncbi:hypothetical protein SAMN02745216_02534 [Desulfatibacillum alkenivorans DSM 16219]|jgi:hypothetical protein|uniref:Sensory transduction regulator n=1 Tax=Desulfatibacillum alkenivorans DSM 16219 TaxID=1121393 RepID=A0A1M6N6R3_9BACT|nr:hypothetical protein [Desulfatibacillum alkenivorans]SHJ91398.1 hypothetical protein SAMN02745216_02534 [Desulfatibacillum alkenivorans DSM 16219]